VTHRYDEFLASLEPCPVCGRVDVMDNIEGQLLCAACFLDEQDSGEWNESEDEDEWLP
jgi:NMD protein affecting ribosome stability and mRNA decay